MAIYSCNGVSQFAFASRALYLTLHPTILAFLFFDPLEGLGEVLYIGIVH